MNAKKVKQIAKAYGAAACGIANVERFSAAPEGFHPKDVFQRTESVVAFLLRMPEAVLEAENPIPYTLTAYSLYSGLDGIAHRLCLYFDGAGFSAVPIPADTPYISWNESEKRGQGIISLKHAAQLAGLGFLGRSTLLINPKFGNLVYIGAILTDLRLQPDPILESFYCPESCKICINVCPKGAIGTLSVNQKLCREVSFYKNERGFDIYDCKECRKRCPLRNGQKKNEKFPG